MRYVVVEDRILLKSKINNFNLLTKREWQIENPIKIKLQLTYKIMNGYDVQTTEMRHLSKVRQKSTRWM